VLCDLMQTDVLRKEDIIINNLDICFFETFLKARLIGGYVQKIQMVDYAEQYLKIKINTKEKNEILIVGNGICVLTKYNPPAKIQNKGFSKTIGDILENKKILDIRQINMEKILLFEFSDFYLILELFSHNNIILTNKEYVVIDCLKKEVWKDRTIRPKQKYKFPDADFINPNNYVFDKDRFNMKNNIVSNIVKEINVSPGFVESLIEETNIDKTKYSEKDLKKVISEIKKIFNCEFSETNTYLYKNTKNKFELFPVLFTKKQECVDLNINYLLDLLFVKDVILSKANIEKEIKNKEIRKVQDIISGQEKKMVQFEKKVVEEKIKGDLIYENYNKIECILQTINKGLNKKMKLEDIEKILLNKKMDITDLNIFKKIDKKNKRVIFTLHHPQQVVSHQQ